MTFLPHLINDYSLPFHVDEWINWAYTNTFIQTGSTSFINPFTGGEIIHSLEIGFTVWSGLTHFLSGSNLQTIFLFMPSILMVFISISLFNIGQKSTRKYGLESAFLVGFIPTTIQLLGPSFYVAVIGGIFLCLSFIWLHQMKSFSSYLLMFPLLWLIFIIHPPSTIFVIIYILSYMIIKTLNHNYKEVWKSSIFIINGIIILILAFVLDSVWSTNVNILFTSIFGTQYSSFLINIPSQINLLGIVIWILFIIGIYYSLLNKESCNLTFLLSAIFFIVILGLYSNFGYGVPILFERGWLYLYFLVTIIAGMGLHSIINDVYITKFLKKINKSIASKKFISILFVLLLIITIMPLQVNIPYYETITEEEYLTFNWVHHNIEKYDTEYINFNRAAVDPNIAATFSAITGIYTISSKMHPEYGKDEIIKMKTFLGRQCKNISYLENKDINVIFGNCNNSNFTKILDQFYLYYGVVPDVNFSISNLNASRNETIIFKANFQNEFSQIIDWNWDFGDGNESVGEISGLSFDGDNDYVIIPDNRVLDIGSQLTIEIWLEPFPIQQQVALVGKKLAYQLWLSNDQWFFGVFNNSNFYVGTGYSSVINTNQPYRVFGIYDQNKDNDTLQLWINNSLMKAFDYDQQIRYNDLPFYIGGKLSNWGNQYFNGIIKEVRLYNRALNKTEIMVNNNQTNSSIITDGLISWWQMNQTGKYVIDSINGFNGEIFGASWVNTVSHQYEKPGIYDVNLSVLSDTGLKNFHTTQIKIN